MDRASQAEDRGSINGYDAEGLAYFFGCEPEQVDAIVSAMADKGMVSNGRLTSWEKRQPKREDDSSKRVREYRERKTHQSKRDVTHRNAPDTDTDTDSSDAKASSSPEPAKAAPVQSPVVIDLPCVSGDSYPVRETDVSEWEPAFPGVEIHQQLAVMRSWLIANPTRRKTRKGMRRFIVSWLERQQNSAPASAPQQRATAPPKRTVGQQARDELRKMGLLGNATDDETRYIDQGDGSADFASSGIARRFAIASSR
jgi:hypothetical protein